MLNRIISLIEKKKNELLKLESEDFNTGVTEMYVAVKEILDKHNEGCHVFISDKDFLDKQKAVSKEFLQECKEVADKYKKRSSTNVSKTETTDWIPVTERLPEDIEYVLVTVNGRYKTDIFEGAIMLGDYSSKFDEWIIEGLEGWKNPNVIAWMPLPPKYEGE